MLVLLVGCYEPNLQPCTVRCRLTFDCPSGMACADDQFCHANVNETACPCIPLTCNDIPDSCGMLDNLCGSMVDCGQCTQPLECGVGGTPNQCADPGDGCTPAACSPNECGPSTDSCGNPRTCPMCPAGKKCEAGRCVACTPNCATNVHYACGDDGCGGSCGTCPDTDSSPGSNWQCYQNRYCCIGSGEKCFPATEGCDCCPGLFCQSGFCEPSAGCELFTEEGLPAETSLGEEL
jgi:hypothetical protein